MIYLAVLAFGVTLGLPIAVIFASTAQGKATSTALEGIARQPESAAKIQTAMIIGLALIESLVIYSLLMFFILVAKLPEGDMLRGMIDASAGKAQIEEVMSMKTVQLNVDENGTTNGVEIENVDENQ